MSLEPRQELNHRQSKGVVQLEDIFAANVEGFDSLIADAQGFGVLRDPNGHHTGGLKILVRVIRSKETHRKRSSNFMKSGSSQKCESFFKEGLGHSYGMWRIMCWRTARRPSLFVASE